LNKYFSLNYFSVSNPQSFSTFPVAACLLHQQAIACCIVDYVFDHQQ